MGGRAVTEKVDKTVERAEAMRTFMRALTPKSPGWKLIGRRLYRRGTYGVFSLSVWSGGTSQYIAGLNGEYLSHEGGTNHMTFRFEDLLVPDPRVPHVNWDGRAIRSHESDWEWYMRPPKSLTPLHAAIEAWTDMFDSR